MKSIVRLLITLAWCAALLNAPFCLGQTTSQTTDAIPASPTSGDETRPHLIHQTGKQQDEKALDPDASILKPSPARVTSVLVAPGLHLPEAGRVWALDEFGGKPELVHLKYSQVSIDSHTASNLLKTQAAPFIYKPKSTIEIKGANSAVRLHDPSPKIFLRGIWEDEADAESNDGGGQSELALIRLESKPDRRVAGTIAFTQVTGKAARSEQSIDVTTEPLPGTRWLRMRPKQPLPPGEYGLMRLPKGQNLFGEVIYDFAIDPTAPEVKDSIKVDTDSSR